MSIRWAITANASHCRVFEAKNHSQHYVCLENFTHPASRQKNQDLITGAPNAFRHGGSSGQPQLTAKDEEKRRFAASIIDHLDDARKKNKFDDLVVVASPSFMGDLKAHMNNHLKKRVSYFIPKDYTQLTEKEACEELLHLRGHVFQSKRQEAAFEVMDALNEA